MGLKREVNCNKEPLIWGHLDTKAKEELEDDTRGNKKVCCDCRELKFCQGETSAFLSKKTGTWISRRGRMGTGVRYH